MSGPAVAAAARESAREPTRESARQSGRGSARESARESGRGSARESGRQVRGPNRRKRKLVEPPKMDRVTHFAANDSTLVGMTADDNGNVCEFRSTNYQEDDSFPDFLLPTTTPQDKHRTKNTTSSFLIPACVARPAGRLRHGDESQG